MQDIVFPIADFLEMTFEILPTLGNLPNNLFIILGFILMFYWIKELFRYKKEAKENGTIE